MMDSNLVPRYNLQDEEKKEEAEQISEMAENIGLITKKERG